MSLYNCPFDPETGLWVLRSAWMPTMCQRCEKRPVTALVELGDHNAELDITRHVCRECALHYMELPKKETT